MIWLVPILQRIWRTLLRFFDPRYIAEVIREKLPPALEKRRIYIVEESGYQERAVFLCPCGCGEVLYLNLLTEERPCWHINIHSDGTASLKPSVWRKKGCKSHFWLKDGRVHWCV